MMCIVSPRKNVLKIPFFDSNTVFILFPWTNKSGHAGRIMLIFKEKKKIRETPIGMKRYLVAVLIEVFSKYEFGSFFKMKKLIKISSIVTRIKFTCSKSISKTLEKSVKYVQS